MNFSSLHNHYNSSFTSIKNSLIRFNPRTTSALLMVSALFCPKLIVFMPDSILFPKQKATEVAIKRDYSNFAAVNRQQLNGHT